MNQLEFDKKYALLKEKFERHEQILVQAYKSLKQKELKLKQLNDELVASEEEIKANNEELRAANEEITTINEELYSKNTIIEKQNAELRTTMLHLKATQAELLQAEKMASLGILTAGVAHEINNPLNYIMGAYFGLQAYFKNHPPFENEKVSIFLESLKEGVSRASKIVESLNQFSRNNQEDNEQCNIVEIIDNCLVILNNKIKHHIEVKKNYCDKKIWINGNNGKLHQVFLNILTNAQQAITDKGEIKIDIKKTADESIIEIEDTGIGISEENIKKITDPFFTTKAPGKGIGLGLSITYNIIKEHNGTLNFQSELAKGTTVQIKFPLAQITG